MCLTDLPSQCFLGVGSAGSTDKMQGKQQAAQRVFSAESVPSAY